MMRTSMIALSLVFVFALGCGGKKKAKKGDACAIAKGEAADKWQAAVGAWTKVDKGWGDPELVKVVTKALHAKASGPMAKATAMVALKSFEGYLVFKKAHAAKSLTAVKAAHAASGGEDLGLARKKAIRAFGISGDKSNIRGRKEAWFSNPNVVAVDEQQRKAYNLVTEGRALSKKAAETCAKK
jgi:hypothetical protein